MNWFYAVILCCELVVLIAVTVRTWRYCALRHRAASTAGLLLLVFAGAQLAAAMKEMDSRTTVPLSIVSVPPTSETSANREDIPPQPEIRQPTIRNYVGQRLPWAKPVDLFARFTHGDWIVLICSQHDSESWQFLLANCLQPSMLHFSEAEPQIAVISVGDGKTPSSDNGNGILMARVTSEGLLPKAGRLPLALCIREGVLLRVSQCGRSYPDYRKARQQAYENAVACGPLALITVLNYFRIPCDEATSRAILDAAKGGATTLSQLKELAETHGLQATGIRVSPEELKRIGVPAIVHLNGSSFAAVLGYNPSGFNVFYQRASPIWLANEVFAKEFGNPGRALLLSTAPLRVQAPTDDISHARFAGAPTRLRLSRSAISLGRVYKRDWQGETIITNDGPEPVEIQSVVPSCSCIKAVVSSPLLLPSETSTLRVTGRNDNLSVIAYDVTVKTSAPGAQTIVVPVRGYVEPPVLIDPPTINFGRIPVRRKARAFVAYQLSDDLSPNSLKIVLPAASCFRARVISTSHNNGLLEIECIESPSPRHYDRSIFLESSDVPDAASAELRLSADIVAALEPFPRSIVIRPDEVQASWSRHITIVANLPPSKVLSTRWSDQRFASTLQVVSHPIKGTRGFLVDVTPTRGTEVPADLDQRAQLICECGDASRCDVDVLVKGIPHSEH